MLSKKENPNNYIMGLFKRNEEVEYKAIKSGALSGRKVVEMGLVFNLIDESTQIQPAGIDFTVGRISRFTTNSIIDFDNLQRRLPGYEEISFFNQTVKLNPGGYLVEFNEAVKLPKNIIGIMRTRSSVFRSGAALTAGIIDPGYEGAIGALLQVWNTNGFVLKENARLAQWIFLEIKEPSGKIYEGKYKGAKSIF